jgi:hypothetical protein
MNIPIETVATIFEKAAKRKKKRKKTKKRKRTKEEREVYKHYGFGWPGTDKDFAEDMPTPAPVDEPGVEAAEEGEQEDPDDEAWED